MFQQSLRLIEQEIRELNENNAQRNRQPSVAALLRLSNRRKLIKKKKTNHFLFFF